MAAEFNNAGLAILQGLTAVCHEPGEAATEALRSALSKGNEGLRLRAREVVDRLCDDGAPAPLIALHAAVESRARLETFVTHECRMLADGAGATGSCGSLLDPGMTCANSLAELSQHSQAALRWTVEPNTGAADFAAWVYHEDGGRTLAAALTALLEERLAEAGGDGGRDVLMAEIGVRTGEISAELLARFPKLRMLLVDPYHLREDGAAGGASDERGSSAASLDMGAERTRPYRERATFVLQGSVEAAEWLAPGSLDLVFVGGDYSHDGASGDIRAWWPALQPGGVLAGQDYALTWPGVVRAVNDFALGEGLAVHLTPEVWWLAKPPPAGAAGAPPPGPGPGRAGGACVRPRGAAPG